MSVIEITGTAGAVIAVGAYARWAVKPVLIAYRVGRVMGQRLPSK